MKKILCTSLFLVMVISLSQAQGLPDNPEIGKCYVKCITKDEYREIEERIEVSPEYTKLQIVPATYKTVKERLLIKEATKKFVYVPATYETKEVSYVAHEGRSELTVVPASFKTNSKTMEVYPKTSGWKYTLLDDCSSLNKEDCVAACYVEFPARFTNVNYTSLVSDASISSVPVAEKTKVYKKRVIKTPARVEEIEIPAEYTTITRQVVDTPAHTTKVVIPATYETIKKSVLEKKGGITTWEEVSCELLNPTILPIFYELDSARLTPDSKRIIDERLLPLLSEKAVNIEIMSHTDSRGDDDYNMSLSQQRANSVVNYLVSKGISRSRLAAKGYGESRLTNGCSNDTKCSESDHQKNRRTEFRVLSN